VRNQSIKFIKSSKILFAIAQFRFIRIRNIICILICIVVVRVVVVVVFLVVFLIKIKFNKKLLLLSSSTGSSFLIKN